MFENLIIDSVLLYQMIVSYDGQDDDVGEDISLLSVCANVLIVEKDDVDFVINKIVLDLSMKNVGYKRLKKVTISHILTIGHFDVEHVARKGIVAKKAVVDLVRRLFYILIFSGIALEDSCFLLS